MSPALPSLILRQNFTRIRIDIGLLELLKLTFSQILGFKFKWRRCESRSCEVPPFTSHAVWFELQWDVRRLNIHWKLCLLLRRLRATSTSANQGGERVKESRRYGGNKPSNPTCHRKLSKWTQTTCCCLLSRPLQYVPGSVRRLSFSGSTRPAARQSRLWINFFSTCLL